MPDVNIDRLLGRLEEGIKNVSKQLPELIARFESFKDAALSRLSNVENRIDNFFKKQKNCNKSFENLQKRASSLESRLQDAENYVNRLKEEESLWQRYKAYIYTGIVTTVLSTLLSAFLEHLPNLW